MDLTFLKLNAKKYNSFVQIGMQSEHARWLVAPSSYPTPFLKGRPLRVINERLVQYDVGSQKVQYDPQQSFEVGEGIYPDMCEMTVLNEPEVIRNLAERYERDDIFTYIGPTLIALNPYRTLPHLFNQQSLKNARTLLNKNIPHVYALAQRAFQCLEREGTKQAIVISGESGAGKTQSTKFCMEVITRMTADHQIEKRILACNPLLQAFGNSKTIRNDNSSRFGKYVQIFYSSNTQERRILGANVLSYLLEKSRVVSVAPGQRSFHAFYALTASRGYGVQEASYYRFLKQSNCYTSSHVDDKAYFMDVNASMKEIGFSQKEQDKIWKTLAAILHLGNITFDDRQHNNDLTKPCEIVEKKQLGKAVQYLEINVEIIQKLLLFEKKIILKETTFNAYNKSGCEANRNTICKAIYNSVFQTIIKRISQNLGFEKHPKIQPLSINLLDIFGFENFDENSLEQLCINFTNERLLKEYNAYIFQRQMQILKQDGLEKAIQDIKAPTNSSIISLLNGKLSIFSIINDTSSGQQFKDQDIVHGLQKNIKQTNALLFDKISRLKFTVKHSQCEVTYNADSFRFKNLDKLNTDTESLLQQLFQVQPSAYGKTLLYKFTQQIDKLIVELSSSKNHFIRCIKPNQKKSPKCLELNYLLTQVRYLGVFQTIQIRKKTFPSRYSYEEFYNRYQPLFRKEILEKRPKAFVDEVLKTMKTNVKQYLLGTIRVYFSAKVDEQLNLLYMNFMKKKQEMAKKILLFYRKYKFKKNLLIKLKVLVKRKNIWRIIEKRQRIKIFKAVFLAIKDKIKNIKKKIDPSKLQLIVDKIKRRIMSEGFSLIQKKAKDVAQFLLNETVIVEKSQVTSYRDPNKQQTIRKQEVAVEHRNSRLNESILEEPSLQSKVVFSKTLHIAKFDPTKGNLQKLKLILLQEYQTQIIGGQDQFFSPSSQDCTFNIESTEQTLFNKIICFDANEFFQRVLRVRKTFIGSRKNYTSILAAKGRPLTKSLTLISQIDEQKAIKIFKLIVRIQQQSKLNNVFMLIENMINLCQATSVQLKNEVFLQLLKESNTSNELASVRVYQSLSVFLHIFSPDNDFLLAGLHLLFQRQRQGKLSAKEDQYLRYISKKIVRKLQNTPVIGYMPIKYQMMALMCKRQISIPIYLPIGKSVIVRIQSYHTFSDIKEIAIAELGINLHRFKAHHFHFFQIVNFQNQELEEAPINENQIVWDMLTYWELAKSKYQDTNINPPAFFLMLKLTYPFELHEDDVQGIELLFAQCYFDYFIGRIRLSLQNIGFLAACVKAIKLSRKPQNQIVGSFPMWISKLYAQEELSKLLQSNLKMMKDYPLLYIKFRFLKVCEQSPLTMAFAIPTTSQIKLFLRPRKIYLSEQGKILDSYNLNQIVRWTIDKQKFVFDVKGATNSHVTVSHAIYTQYASICSQYLADLTKKS